MHDLTRQKEKKESLNKDILLCEEEHNGFDQHRHNDVNNTTDTAEFGEIDQIIQAEVSVLIIKIEGKI